jgi:hypothetical protein
MGMNFQGALFQETWIFWIVTAPISVAIPKMRD